MVPKVAEKKQPVANEVALLPPEEIESIMEKEEVTAPADEAKALDGVAKAIEEQPMAADEWSIDPLAEGVRPSEKEVEQSASEETPTSAEARETPEKEESPSGEEALDPHQTS